MNGFATKIRRGETPFFRTLKNAIKLILHPRPPRLPSLLKAPLQLVYQAYWGLIVCWRAALSFFCTNPLFQSRCASFGSNVSVGNLPYIAGPVQVHIGNHCWIGGELAVFSGHTLPNPQFIMQDHAEIGWNVRIVVNEQVLLEEHCRVSNDCRISDSDGHPRQADLRAQGLPMDRKDIRPVRIGKHAWIGNGTHIMKGVTIGEGAVIGANSVVISDIPPYCLALGNPAEVLFRNYGKPSRATRTSGSPAGPGPGA